MFTLTIQTDNAAFHDDHGDDLATRQEVARILTKIANRLEEGDCWGSCRDYNGQQVGHWRLDNEEV